MKTAREMIEELGYSFAELYVKWSINGQPSIIDRFTKIGVDYNEKIDFDSFHKTVEKYSHHWTGSIINSSIITMQEFKAIHKYLEEKGWLDDE